MGVESERGIHERSRQLDVASLLSRSTTYADQLTATVEAEIAYSSSRFQPMNQASASPSVAYV